MSNIINLLDQLGQTANLSEQTQDKLVKQMQDLELSELTQKAILEGNADALEDLLALSPIISQIIIIEESHDDSEKEAQAINRKAG